MTIRKYGGRYWALYDDAGELVCICRLLSRDRKSSEQFVCFNRRYHEMKAELALSGIVPSVMSEMNQEEAI